MPLLDRSETADFFRNHSKRNRDVMIGRGQMFQQLLDQLLVVGDQAALGLALGRMAKGIEYRAAQETEFRQAREDLHYPGAKRHLLRLAGLGIAAREQRRRKVKFIA